MFRNKSALFLLVCVFLLFASCASTKAKILDVFPVHGMIYDDNGKAVEGAQIVLDGETKTVSDFNGRFVFPHIPPGEYLLVATKSGMEKLSQKIEVKDFSDVIYIKMITLEGLYRSYTTVFGQKNWIFAREFLDRALAIKPSDPLLRYADAVLQYVPERLDRDAQKSEAILLALLKEGYRYPAIYLLLADIAQYDTKDTAAAKLYLEEHMKLIYDPIVEERYRSLTQDNAIVDG